MLLIGQDLLSLQDVFNVSRLKKTVQLSKKPAFKAKLQASVDLVEAVFKKKQIVYGINTNFGGLAKGTVSLKQASKLQENLLWGLHCSLGQELEPEYVRAAMLIRANTLAKGVSSIRLEILERLVLFLNHHITPHIRDLGSLGASGDLVPLSYIAAATIGLDPCIQVNFKHRRMSCITALKKIGLKPIKLRPKEALALVNGTSVLSGIAALVTEEFKSLLALTLWINAVMCQSLMVSNQSFDEKLHQLKPHPGQIKVARILRQLLGQAEPSRGPADLHQDQYSIRCIPQYFGPLLESLEVMDQQIETEINSADDNPLADMENKRFLHGGNFYGQYVALAMDQLRQSIALCAKQLDVQISLLCTPEFSRGLPPSLSVGNQEILFGLKGLQITCNSIVPRLLHLANPMVQLFPTHAEQFNQNINSQGFNAAILARDSINFLRIYLSAAIIFSIQSIELRSQLVMNHYDASNFLSPCTQALYFKVNQILQRKASREYPLIYTGNHMEIDSLVDLIHQDLKNPESQIKMLMSTLPV